MNLHPALHKTIFLPSIDSTNLELHRIRNSFSGKNVLLISDEQTKGKGQQGRQWDSKAGKGLWMSLLLSQPEYLGYDLKLLSIYTGIILRRTLQKYLKSEIQLKWPNDVIIHSKKCGGILTEIQWQGNTAASAIVGLGVNLFHDYTDFPRSIQDTATSLKMEGAESLDRIGIAELFLVDFFSNFSSLDNAQEMIDEWNSHAFRLDNTVNWKVGDESHDGQFKGINEAGEACLLINGNLCCFKNGEFRITL